MPSTLCWYFTSAVRTIPGLLGSDGRMPWVRWDRLFMGLKPSPYNSVRHFYWAEEFVRGDPSLKDNPFAFDQVILNLPGTKDYNPRHAKVLKRDSRKNGMLRSRVFSGARLASPMLSRLADAIFGNARCAVKEPCDWIGGSSRIIPDGIWILSP